MKEFIKINSKDNVIIVLRDYRKDEIIKIDGKVRYTYIHQIK